MLHGPNVLGPATLLVLSRRDGGPSSAREPAPLPPARLTAALAEFGLDGTEAAGPLPTGWAALVADLSTRILARVQLPPMPVRTILPDREIAFAAGDLAVSLACLRLALELYGLTDGAEASPRGEVDDLWRAFRAAAKSRRGSRHAIGEACRALDLPFHFYSHGRPVQIGEGRHRLLLDLSDTSTTPHFAVKCAKDKVATSQILALNGIPVARQRVAETPAAAWRHAREIGLPVVVKPRFGNHGRGVTIGVADEAKMQQAFAMAHEVGPHVLVESFIPGADHRVMVVCGRVTAVVRHNRPCVVGDGRRSVRALVDAANRDLQGTETSPIVLGPVAEELLRAAGRDFEFVPAAGEAVFLHMRAGQRVGGVPIDVTEMIHPATAEMLVSATAIVGLDVAGIDFRCPDITRPWTVVGGGICEVNSGAGLGGFVETRPQWFREGLVAPLAGGRSLRMRHLAVIGGDGARALLDALARGLAAALQQKWGWRLSLALSDSLWLDGYRASPAALAPYDAYIRAIENPLLDAAIYVVTPGIVEAHGFGLARLDLALCGATSVPSSPAEQWLRRVCAQAGARVIDHVAAGQIDAVIAQWAEAA